MNSRLRLLGLVALWPVAAWLYMQVGTMYLMLDPQTGDQYCIDGFGFRFEEDGPYSYMRRALFFGSALFMVALPLRLLVQMARRWRRRRTALLTRESSSDG